VFQTKIVEKIKTHFMFNNACLENRVVYENVEKYWSAGQATDDNKTHAHCTLRTEGYKHTHTHTQNTQHIAFPLQQWLREPALCYVMCTFPVLFKPLQTKFNSFCTLRFSSCRAINTQHLGYKNQQVSVVLESDLSSDNHTKDVNANRGQNVEFSNVQAVGGK
jgi:hypothetical protein